MNDYDKWINAIHYEYLKKYNLTIIKQNNNNNALNRGNLFLPSYKREIKYELKYYITS